MDTKCGFCNLGEEASVCGSLHCEEEDGKIIAAHHKCMQYSALLVQYKSDHFGGFKLEKVKKELQRAKKLPCAVCRKKGAPSGCAWASCRRGYHFPCAFNNPSTITKRYKVQSGSKTVILYRVFCSSTHEQAYRQNIKVSGMGKSSPEKPKESKSESSNSSLISKRSGKELETRNNQRHEPNEKSEDDEEGEDSRRINESLVSADLNDTGASFLDSPRMTGREVVEETQKEYFLLKKRKAGGQDTPEEKRPRTADNRNNNSSDSSSLPSGPLRSNVLHIDADHTVSQPNHYDLSPEASDNESDQSEDTILQEVGNDKEDDCSEVVLLIPSLLSVPANEMDDVYKEFDIPRDKSIVWPRQDRTHSLQDKHLPHIMWHIVETIRNKDFGNLMSILNNGSGEKYDYFVNFHSQDSNNITQQVFHSSAEKLSQINSVQPKKIGQLISRKYQKMKILVLYLSEKCPGHKGIIAGLQSSLYEWNRNTLMKNTPSRKHSHSSEFERLWKWFKFRLKFSFQIDSCPVEEVFLNDNFSSAVTSRLLDKLSVHKRCSSFGTNTSGAILAIDSANRDIIKYEVLVKKAVERFVANSLCKEIFFIISVDQGDNIHMIEDILPSHLVGRAMVYTAFNPEEVSATCIVIHLQKADTEVEFKGRKTSPNSSEQKRSRTSKGSPALEAYPVVSLSGAANLRNHRLK